MGAELGQYILQTQLKNYEDSMGGSLNAPSGYAGGLTYSYGKSDVNVWSTCQ